MVVAATLWRTHPKGALFSAWRARDGFLLRRMDWPASGRRRRRGALLFAGGRGDFIEKYLEAFAGWRAAGWDVTAFDWRGQGRSQGELAPGRLEGFDAQMDDLAALIDDWRKAASGPHVAIGHSMGGHILLKTIVERAPALDGAVLVAPMIMVNSGPIPAWLAPDVADTMSRLGFRRRPLWHLPPALARPGSERQRRLTASRARYEDELYWWGEAPEFNLGAPTWGWVRAAYASAAASFTAEKLARVALPILILATDRDALVDARAIGRVAAQLPTAEIAWLAGARHEILREADPIRNVALARIDSFLAGLAK
jgi:lysophospholipase